jgi:hypothetical protein
MDRRLRRLIAIAVAAVTCLVFVTAPLPAEQRDPVQQASSALRVNRVHTLHLSGFGATYDVSGSRIPLTSYHADVDVARDAESSPQGFLKAARANHAIIRAVPLGTEVTFTAGGRSYIGFINGDHEVDRVHTWVDDPLLGHVRVETLFRGYQPGSRGIPFPMHITQSRGNHPSLDLWLSAVDIR